MVTGAVELQVVQRRKPRSAEAESRKESTKSNASVDVPLSNSVQETESNNVANMELSRMSIISSDCVAALSVPVNHGVEAETKVGGPPGYTHSYSIAIRSDLSHI